MLISVVGLKWNGQCQKGVMERSAVSKLAEFFCYKKPCVKPTPDFVHVWVSIMFNIVLLFCGRFRTLLQVTTDDRRRRSDAEVYRRWDNGCVLLKMRRHEAQRINEWIRAGSLGLYLLNWMFCWKCEKEADISTGSTSASWTTNGGDTRHHTTCRRCEVWRASVSRRNYRALGSNEEWNKRLATWEIVLCETSGYREDLNFQTTTRLTHYQGIVSNSFSSDTLGATAAASTRVLDSHLSSKLIE